MTSAYKAKGKRRKTRKLARRQVFPGKDSELQFIQHQNNIHRQLHGKNTTNNCVYTILGSGKEYKGETNHSLEGHRKAVVGAERMKSDMADHVRREKCIQILLLDKIKILEIE